MEAGANARRRRLVNRGTDRLAFITGQAPSLPSDPPPDLPIGAIASRRRASVGDLSGENFSNIVQLQKSEPRDLIPQIKPTAEVRHEHHKAKSISIDGDLFLGLDTRAPEIQPVNETPLQRHGAETLSTKISHDRAESVPRREMETAPRSVRPTPNPSNLAEHAACYVETLKEHLNFSPHEITQAISATEYNRLLASIGVAFLVVLSNWGLDVGGIFTRVLVGTRPLLFLIITNISMVYTLLMENKDPNVRGRPAGINLMSADIGQLLEIGLLLQKALGALLIDCSVCAVIMICFL